MPNYEELYYIARNNYNRAIENRDAIRKNASELQGKKTTLTRELGEKQSALVAIQQKKLLVQEAFDKCKHILENEFPTMKKDLQTTSDEYKKSFHRTQVWLIFLQYIQQIFQVQIQIWMRLSQSFKPE